MEPVCVTNMNRTMHLVCTPKRSQNSTPNPEIQTKKDSRGDRKNKSAIKKLLEKIPQVEEHFDVIKKIGEGTFSSVFVATSKHLIEKKTFAVKHVTPTSHPSRIIQEMKCLEDIGGHDNVVGLELCFRNHDAVAFVMPYFAHDSFSNFILVMSVAEVQMYMKNLLIALKRVHSFDIIHRDIKPSNFLYNRKDQRFLLVDFGLSHKVECSSHRCNSSSAALRSKNTRKRLLDLSDQDAISNERKRPVLHSLSNNVPGPSGDRSSASAMKHSNKKKSPIFKENSPVSRESVVNRNIRQVTRNLQFGNITPEVKKNIAPSILNEKFPRLASVQPPVSFNNAGTSYFRVQNSQIKSQMIIAGVHNNALRKPALNFGLIMRKDCDCDRKARICNRCMVRKPMHAPRAGTPGYRPPEVLLKYPHQTTAVDIWSAGVIMLSILSCSYPFFRAPDDVSALMEIISVFGTAELTCTASKLGRNLLTNENRKPLNLNKLCERLRKRRSANKIENDAEGLICRGCSQEVDVDGVRCLCDDPIANGYEGTKKELYPPEAYDLLSKLLCVDPGRRISAEDALGHPFFQLNLTGEQ